MVRRTCADAVAPAAYQPSRSWRISNNLWPAARVLRNTTYRLNPGAGELPSQFRTRVTAPPAATNASRRLEVLIVQQLDLVDAILAPQHPVSWSWQKCLL